MTKKYIDVVENIDSKNTDFVANKQQIFILINFTH